MAVPLHELCTILPIPLHRFTQTVRQRNARLPADLTPEGVAKARRFLEARGVSAEVRECDLAREPLPESYNLVIAVNSVQFMGEYAEPCLERLMAVNPGGVIGHSLFACEDASQRVVSTILFISLEELLRRFAGWQPLEAAKLWQWNASTGQPQAFVTLIARKMPPAGIVNLQL